MSYAVTYNWPSDGVSLWYDYRNSVEAYHSPAWTASSLTQVNGSWTVNSSTGASQGGGGGQRPGAGIPVDVAAL